MRSDLGVAPVNDRDGCMQDVHWYSGNLGGAFHGYTIGNILSAQLYEAAVQAHPEIPAEIQTGTFNTLHTWLRKNIYQHGRKFGADELVKRSTGSTMTIEPYIRYLRVKFGELYGLQSITGLQ
jgi:carboxypeptidase Taq